MVELNVIAETLQVVLFHAALLIAVSSILSIREEEPAT
jgi:hypothetical protein